MAQNLNRKRVLSSEPKNKKGRTKGAKLLSLVPEEDDLSIVEAKRAKADFFQQRRSNSSY
jgi:hypothetical protein